MFALTSFPYGRGSDEVNYESEVKVFRAGKKRRVVSSTIPYVVVVVDVVDV